MKKLTLLNVKELKHWENFFKKYFSINYKLGDSSVLVFKDEDTINPQTHQYKNFIPSLKLCKLFNDKSRTNSFLIKNGFSGLKTTIFKTPFQTLNKIITKPVDSTGRFSFRVWDEGETVNAQPSHIIQPFIEGTEYNLDILKDGAENVYVCAKEKILIKAGMTFKCKVSQDKSLINLGKRLASVINYIGSIDVDVIKDNRGGYFIIDINPRLGGGFLHSINLDTCFEENVISILNGGVIINDNNCDYIQDKCSTVVYKYELV